MRATSRSRVTSPSRAGLDDDIAELFFALRRPLRIDGKLQIEALGSWASAPTTPAAACDVLRPDRLDDVARRSGRVRAAFCGSTQTRIE